ncbi:DUF3781 domain-containing protein [Treponema brennaborense]|uniref:DUF3781 domain-containing protein n=1 Tax=Treponema brennaborense (strain DSM 12168 / CIP 105900 / DD5/3) TaxID=906968 RepID=F4LLD3_TREBD|nr:DUF3781 domain-containing protein [Treponema brennaborense]AEE15611.1 hypothetical protein Trebr_0160 [Treponema brennaborense DSM 12168]
MDNTESIDVLRNHVRHVHTTPLGAERIKRNLGLSVPDVVAWCRNKILDSRSRITRRGKNWYVLTDDCEITVNAYSYTVITAHTIEASVTIVECI